MASKLLSILGPTASGKSSLAMRLAEALDGEIICCDSMTVYRGLDIGTAKPSLEDQASVPHHLLDILDIEEPFDTSRFVALATPAVEEVLARGKQPILCGGTGLYARALLYGLTLQPSDSEISASIRETFEAEGIEPLLTELKTADPASATRTCANPRRVMRALEIVRITGSPVQPEADKPPPFAAPEFVIIPQPETSRRLITRRTEMLLEQGWLEEVAGLVERGLLTTPTASQALGYRDIAAWLAAGGTNRKELLETLIRLTSRYAKRQRTWFRHQHKQAVQLELPDTPDTDELTETIMKAWTEHLDPGQPDAP